MAGGGRKGNSNGGGRLREKAGGWRERAATQRADRAGRGAVFGKRSPRAAGGSGSAGPEPGAELRPARQRPPERVWTTTEVGRKATGWRVRATWRGLFRPCRRGGSPTHRKALHGYGATKLARAGGGIRMRKPPCVHDRGQAADGSLRAEGRRGDERSGAWTHERAGLWGGDNETRVIGVRQVDHASKPSTPRAP